MSDDEWVKAAMTDDTVVVDILLRLNRLRRAKPISSPSVSGSPAKTTTLSPPLQLDWTVRQRRSKSTPRLSDGKKKGAEPTRASPTTPLSWSGNTSGSGGATVDGFEESSKPAKLMDGSRSKVAVTGETTTNKRSRKKKTLAELREEESMLLKERRSLENELKTLRVTVEKQRDTNESLKRMKLDLQSRQTTKSTATTSIASEEAIPDQPQQMEAVCDQKQILPKGIMACNGLDALPHSFPPNSSAKVLEVRNNRELSSLPDLNLPFDEDSGPEVLYGMS